LVPVGQTEFALDTSFGFAESRLQDWVAEKTGGRIMADDVVSVSLDEIRHNGPKAVAAKLVSLKPNSVCVVNAATMRDIEVVALAAIDAEKAGQRLVWRTAASFVRARAGLGERPLLTCDDLSLPATEGGLIVVGSHTPRTTRQLEQLLTRGDVTGVAIDVERLLTPEGRSFEIDRVARIADGVVSRGGNVVVYTSRAVVTSGSSRDNLTLGAEISLGITEIVNSITASLRYIVTKGGMTSHSIATHSLGVKRATAVGQILPGVPLWRLERESLRPGLIQVPFPGNQGTENSLAELVDKLA